MNKYVSFSGRASRGEFLELFLPLLVTAFVVGAIEWVTKARILGILFVLVTAVPLAALTVRRLHDTGRSGWWFFVGFLPILGQAVLLYVLLQKGERETNRYDAQKSEAAESSERAPESQDIIYVDKTGSSAHAPAWWVGGAIALVILVSLGVIYGVSYFGQSNPSAPQSSKSADSMTDTVGRYTRPALKDDIEGKWEMTYQRNGELVSSSDAFVFPYQRFHFFSDGYVKTISKNEPFDDMSALVWEKSPKSTKYEFLKPGMFVMTGAAGDKTVIQVTLVTQDLPRPLVSDTPLLQQQDLIFSYIKPGKNADTSETYLLRYLRKMSENQTDESK